LSRVLLFLLAGAVGQTVIYSFTSICAVNGSTVTLLCSFTPLKSFNESGREVPLKLVRVRWCQNHEFCFVDTPSVYDSKSTNNNSRYQYLGDMKTNCTLQIRDVQERDEATFRFRMEADNVAGHFTNTTGVNVRVDKKFCRSETVTLLCTSLCTFHQLEVTWYKDGHALSETGPSLHLSPLTAENSGNYTCALKASMNTLSEPYSLQVETSESLSPRTLLSVPPKDTKKARCSTRVSENKFKQLSESVSLLEGEVIQNCN
uniref:Ig-like domain-containing protein n=1 Tax=Amphilophus citrinellus TaxID=61819 RepID=A0A3Q0S7I9_AMPCI